MITTDNTFSVVICAYSDERWGALQAAVASVRQQSLAAQEIIVVIDHNPTLFDRATRQFNGVKVIQNSQAKGLSGARNSGITQARAAIIAFLDDDAVAAHDWLARLSEGYADPLVQGVGGTIQPCWLAKEPGWFPAEFYWVLGCTYLGMPQADAPVRNLIGCNMSFRRPVFEQIEGFRIGRVGLFSMGQEDDETELCIRLSQKLPTARLLYRPSARVQHRVPPNRITLAYFVRRCFSEGLSKATLSRLVGSQAGLSSERAYVTQTLPKGVLKGLFRTIWRRDLTGLGQAALIITGLTVTSLGYLRGLIYQRSPQLDQSLQTKPL